MTTFAEAKAPRLMPKGEIVARAIAGVIVRREFGNMKETKNIRGLALDSAIQQGIDDMWLHLTDEAEAVLIALRMEVDHG